MRESVKAAEALFFIMLGGRLRSVVEGKVEVMKCVELIQMLPKKADGQMDVQGKCCRVHSREICVCRQQGWESSF